MYKVNIPSLARQLLPPILRSPQMMAIVDAMVSGVKRVQALFYEMRSEHIDALRSNAHVIVLEHALNKSVRLKENPIYLTTEEPPKTILYLKDESKPLTLGLITEDITQYVRNKGELVQPSIAMHVPNTIATSVNPNEDKYGGRYLSILSNIMSRYTPISRNYTINIYDYE